MTSHFKPSRVRKPNAANRLRIIGGDWRSRVIEFPDSEGLRPTGNRIRETLFNWLGQTLHGRRCLDLFAGSGALGFEAASRGATEVVMIENDRTAQLALRVNREKLNATACRLIAGDANDFLQRSQDQFDVVFVDPPFASGLLPSLLPKIVPHTKDRALVYIEWGETLDSVLAEPSNRRWQVVKQGKAGVVHFGLLTLAESPT